MCEFPLDTHLWNKILEPLYMDSVLAFSLASKQFYSQIFECLPGARSPNAKRFEILKTILYTLQLQKQARFALPSNISKENFRVSCKCTCKKSDSLHVYFRTFYASMPASFGLYPKWIQTQVSSQVENFAPLFRHLTLPRSSGFGAVIDSSELYKDVEFLEGLVSDTKHNSSPSERIFYSKLSSKQTHDTVDRAFQAIVSQNKMKPPNRPCKIAARSCASNERISVEMTEAIKQIQGGLTTTVKVAMQTPVPVNLLYDIPSRTWRLQSINPNCNQKDLLESLRMQMETMNS